MRRSWSTLCAGVLVAASAAAASAGSEAVRLSYRASTGCPGEARFWDEVAARTDRVRRAGADEPARLFSVLVDAGPTQSRGVLETTDANGAGSRREVTGESCAEVVSALALIAALAIDSQARTDPNPPVAHTEPEMTNRAGPAALPNTVPGPAGSDPSPPSPSTAVVSPQVSPPRPAVRPEVNLASYDWAIGAQGQAAAGLVPVWAPGAGVFVALESKSEEPLSPTFRLTPWFATAHAVFEGALGANITWVVARLEACPVRPVAAVSLRIAACAGMDLGAIRTKGTGLDHPEAEWHPWFAPVVMARLGWSAFDHVDLEFGLGATFPLRRYPFAFDSGNGGQPTDVFQLRPVGALFTIGVAYTVP